MTEIISEAVHELVADAEDLFPPKPGGLVDRHRKRKAAEEAAREAGEASAVVETGRNKVKAVRVISEAADLATATTVFLNTATPVQRLLPRDDLRRSAVVLAVDNDVYIASDPGMAWNVQGANSNTGPFYLPKGIAITVASTAELWVAVTTVATSSRVSVLINRGSAP